MISIEQAFELLDQTVAPLPVQTTSLANSVGCVLAADVKADVNSPPHDKSMMDGFAVRSVDVASGQVRLEVVETIVAGGWPTRVLQSGQAGDGNYRN